MHRRKAITTTMLGLGGLSMASLNAAALTKSIQNMQNLKVRFADNGDKPEEWMAGFPKMADPGTGVFDIPAIISAAKENGVEHFFLERDLTPEPDKTLTYSYDYLRQL